MGLGGFFPPSHSRAGGARAPRRLSSASPPHFLASPPCGKTRSIPKSQSLICLYCALCSQELGCVRVFRPLCIFLGKLVFIFFFWQDMPDTITISIRKMYDLAEDSCKRPVDLQGRRNHIADPSDHGCRSRKLNHQRKKKRAEKPLKQS